MHVDVRQNTLDDTDSNDPVRGILVGNNSARVDVAAADIIDGDGPARVLEFATGDSAVGKGSGDRRQVALRENFVADKPEFANEHTDGHGLTGRGRRENLRAERRSKEKECQQQQRDNEIWTM